MTRISIITPTYNRAHLLPRMIESVLNQSYSDWELIISDDGSTDNTESVIRDFLRDPRIKYIKNKNSGATVARNSGAKVSTGKFLTFLDSDDEAKENWLAAFVELINKGAEVMCCGYEYYDEHGDFIKETLPNKMGGIYGNKIGRFTNGGVFLLKKEYFDEIGGYDEELKAGQHSELAIRLLQFLDTQGIEIVNLFKSLIKVHVHSGPKIRGDNNAVYLGTVRLIEKHESIFAQNKEEYYRFLSVAGVNAIKARKYNEGRKLLKKAFKLKPGSFTAVSRCFIAFLPGIRDMIWNR